MGNTDISITCDANGEPAATLYNWYFSDEVVSKQQVLSLRNIQATSSGVYICSASNAFVQKNRTIELNVQCKYFKGIFRTHQRSMMKVFAKIVNGFYSLVFSAKMLRHKCYRVLNTPLYFEQRYVQDLVSPCLHLRYSREYFYFNCTTGQKFRCTSQNYQISS